MMLISFLAGRGRSIVKPAGADGSTPTTIADACPQSPPTHPDRPPPSPFSCPFRVGAPTAPPGPAPDRLPQRGGRPLHARRRGRHGERPHHGRGACVLCVRGLLRGGGWDLRVRFCFVFACVGRVSVSQIHRPPSVQRKHIPSTQPSNKQTNKQKTETVDRRDQGGLQPQVAARAPRGGGDGQEVRCSGSCVGEVWLCVLGTGGKRGCEF